MYLRSIELRQFRNHSHLKLDVDPGVNLFLGANGAGKTNLIEAIAVLSTGVSPRGAEPEALIEWEKDGFAIRGEFSSERPGREPLTLEMKYRSGASRVIRQNGETPVRLRDLIGRAPLVSFVPEDLSLVKGEPDLRRRAMNLVLAQVDAPYAEALRRYGEAVKSRNAALRQVAEGALTRDALIPWDAAVIEWGLLICRARAEFLEEFSRRASEIHHRVSGRKETIQIEYRPSFPGPWDEGAAQRWHDRFEWTVAQEMAVGATMTGPHRDDIGFSLDGRPARSFASEGQKRTIAVSFKLAEIPYMLEKTEQKPICLLDDVLSELDAERAEHLLFELTRTGQCFVTMTGLESWPAHCQRPASIFNVDASGVHRATELSTENAGSSVGVPSHSGLSVC
jgi:DNA replication and repair protein RecF